MGYPFMFQPTKTVHLPASIPIGFSFLQLQQKKYIHLVPKQPRTLLMLQIPFLSFLQSCHYLLFLLFDKFLLTLHCFLPISIQTILLPSIKKITLNFIYPVANTIFLAPLKQNFLKELPTTTVCTSHFLFFPKLTHPLTVQLHSLHSMRDLSKRGQKLF